MKASKFSHQRELSRIAQTPHNVDLDYTVVHELAQPLTTIGAYIWGCIYRLKNGNQEKETILYIMNKVMQDIEYAQQIVLRMNTSINKVEIS